MDWRNKFSAINNAVSFEPNFNWIKRMNNALTYIEHNLDGNIDYNEVAKLA